MTHGASDPHLVDDQRDVLAFLADAASHGGMPPRLIITHAAVVVLAGDTALKLKRGVRYPFLDYSTPTLRRAACLKELAINRAAAPMIYRDVVAITRDGTGRLAIGGDGTPVDWLLRMHRFADRATLDTWLEDHPTPPDLAARLGEAVAAAHLSAPERDADLWLGDVARYLDQNLTAFREWPELFAAHEVNDLDRAARDWLARITPLVLERGRLGFCRLLHGDLHTRNIAMIDGEPVLFDAVEFDDGIATGDVLYDLAFLIMDLDVRGHRLLAVRVLNLYLGAYGRRQRASTTRTLVTPFTGQIVGGLSAMPFFLMLRAAIRAKVAAARLPSAPEAERAAVAAEASSYFHRARTYLDPAQPAVVAIGGLSGTGKTQAAIALTPWLKPAPGAVLLRTDSFRKIDAGVAMTTRLPPSAYTRESTARIYRMIESSARTIAAAGRSVVADAVFAQAGERAMIEAVAREVEAPFVGLWLTAPLETRLARIEDRRDDASDATAEVARAQEAYDTGPIGWTRIDAGGTPEETRTRILAALAAAGIALGDASDG